MPDKDMVSVWHDRIGRAEALQEKKHTEWNNAIDFYTADWFKKNLGYTDGEDVEVDFVYSYIRVLIPAIYFKNPYIFVRPRPGHENRLAFCETMEKVLNYQWDELELKYKMKKAVLDGVLTPPGWIKIGYQAKWDEPENSVIENDKNIFKTLIKKITGSITKPKTNLETGSLSDEIKEESLYAQHISSWRMLGPAGYHDWRKMPYLIEMENIEIEDLEKNPRYKKAVIKRIVPTRGVKNINNYGNNKITGGYSNSKNSKLDSELNMTRLYHIWNRRDQERFTLAEGISDDTLTKDEFHNWPYSIEGYPYYELIFNEIPQTKDNANAYPMSDIKTLIPQLIELSLGRTQMVKRRKRSGAVVFVKKGQMTPDEINSAQNADDLSIVEVENLPAKDTYQVINQPPLSNDVYKVTDIILGDLYRGSGLTQIQAEGRAPGINTATEATIAQSGSGLRTSEKIDIIEDYTVDIARALQGLSIDFLTREQVSEIIGERVTESMWPVMPTDPVEKRRKIQAELITKIDVGTTRQPKDEMVELKMFTDAMAQIKTLYPNRLKDDVILKQWLKKLKIADFDNAVKSFDEQELQVALQENQLLEQGLVQIVSPNELHEVHIQAHMQMRNKTAEGDKHVIDHGQYMQLEAPQRGGQGGNMISQGPPSGRELSQQGTPEAVDLLGAAKNLGGGTGSNI